MCRGRTRPVAHCPARRSRAALRRTLSASSTLSDGTDPVKEVQDALGVLGQVPGALRAGIGNLFDAVVEDGEQVAGVLVDAREQVQGSLVVDRSAARMRDQQGAYPRGPRRPAAAPEWGRGGGLPSGGRGLRCGSPGGCG